MARPSTAAATWEVPGRPRQPVRLHPPGKGKRSWRVDYLDHTGRPRERTTLDRRSAEALAAGIADELGALLRHGPEALSPIRDADAWYRSDYADSRAWSPKYRLEREWTAGLVERYRPGFGDLECRSFDGALVMEVLNAAARAGHPLGTEHYRRVGAYLSGLHHSGTIKGFFQVPTDARRHPMFDNPYNVGRGRRSRAGAPAPSQVRAVTDDEIPSWDDVDALALAAARLTGVWWDDLRVRMLAGAGLRIGEHVVLRVGDLSLTADGEVDADDPRVHVWRQAVEIPPKVAGGGPTLLITPPKWDSVRHAFYDPDLAPALDRRIREIRAAARPGVDVSDHLLFPDSRGGVSRPRNVRNRVFNPAARTAGWRGHGEGDDPAERWTPHSTRHVYATWLLRGLAMPIKLVADFMGHRDSTFTERRYVHRQQDGAGVAMAVWRARVGARGGGTHARPS